MPNTSRAWPITGLDGMNDTSSTRVVSVVCLASGAVLVAWSDSTTNGMMGCDGCELSSNGNGSGTCYAETLTNFRGGNKGWPKDFFSEEVL